jgi:Lrp/AsnC family transcriptional regulator, leucine-responsive regulatory protein
MSTMKSRTQGEERVLDHRDRQILHLIQKDATLAQSEIARQVGLSTAAVHERIKKLEAAGVVRRWAAIVDPAAVGVSVSAFVEVFLEQPRFEPAFLERVRALDDVLECHHVTGDFSLLLKVRVPDIEGLQRLLLHDLGGLEGVRQTRTVVVLSTVKEETYIAPLPRGEES